MREFLQGRNAYPLLAPIVALLLVLVALEFGLFDRLENMTVDLRFRQRARFDPPADPRVLFVKIDQRSEDVFGRWPWDRTLHAKFCELASKNNVSVVAFDLVFSEPSRDPKSDANLALGFAMPDAVISGAQYVEEQRDNVASLGQTKPLTDVTGDISLLEGSDYALFPLENLRTASLFGFVNAQPSFDGMRRELPLVVRVGKQVFPSLSLQVLCQLWNIAPDKVQVRLGRDIEISSPDGVKSIPIDTHGRLLLNYRSLQSYWPVSLSYSDLLQALYDHDTAQKPFPPNLPALKGKILFIGESDPLLSDNGPSPLEPYSPLPLVHMTALNNILRNDYVRAAPFWPVALAWLVVCWISLFDVRRHGTILSVLLAGGCIVAYLAIVYAVFVFHSFLLPVVWPIGAFILLHSGLNLLRWLEEQRSKREIKQIFASYIAPGVMDTLLSNPEGVRLGGVRRPVTIFFSDIRGFSSLSENMGEEALVTQLNEYFEKMVECVNSYSGTLHKYIGDAVMAAWGDVLSEKEEIDAARGVRSALAMRAAMEGLNAGWRSQNRPELRIGMGLNHGNVLVGNIGATQRREFTLIGDAVNLASRLEGVTKQFHTDLIISDSVHELVRDEFLTRPLGVIQAKGMTRPVAIHEVLDDLKNLRGSWPAEWVERYRQAMQAFCDRKFMVARDLFAACKADRPGDYCCDRYLDLSRELIAHPPGDDWTPLHVMETK
jgi:adenylate cyclase